MTTTSSTSVKAWRQHRDKGLVTRMLFSWRRKGDRLAL
jgi:hypothetical protein